MDIIAKHPILIRILGDILMVCLIAWASWWIVLIVAVIFIFIFPTYYEILLWGICCDALYALPQSGLSQFFHPLSAGYIATVIAIILFFIGFFFKKRLSIYS